MTVNAVDLVWLTAVAPAVVSGSLMIRDARRDREAVLAQKINGSVLIRVNADVKFAWLLLLHQLLMGVIGGSTLFVTENQSQPPAHPWLAAFIVIGLLGGEYVLAAALVLNVRARKRSLRRTLKGEAGASRWPRISWLWRWLW